MIAEEAFPTPEDVVAKIQATPPNSRTVRPARGSLAEALRLHQKIPINH